MQDFSSSPSTLLSGLWRNRNLIAALTTREIIGRYRGSVIGLAWSFFNPILMLVVYTFVFSVVFKSRWGAGQQDNTSFAIILFVGLIVFGLFSECVNRAPGLILANANYVKKVIFPLEILPVVALGAALFHSAISLAVLLAAIVITHNELHWTIILFPVVLLPLIIGTLGISWILASLGVFVRDVGQTIAIVTSVMMFLSPLFYPISSLPPDFQRLILLNPLAFIMEQSREVFIWGRLPDWKGLAIYYASGLAVGWIGYAWFQKTRKGFADVL